MKIKNNINENLLTPRFYVTNYKEFAKLNINSNKNEIIKILQEFKKDYNKNHFFIENNIYSEKIKNSEEFQKSFLYFLERSCIAEFSGFLLYNEIFKNIKKENPLLASGFFYMARDEARHAKFLQKFIYLFNKTKLNLIYLSKNRNYTYFSPKLILYATYLSEKIGYWRYITIYNHIEKNQIYKKSQIFDFFKKWCIDENRHGDFLGLILKSQHQFIYNKGSFITYKFIILAIYITMYLNDHNNKNFYEEIGLNVDTFDQEVIEKTNQTLQEILPINLDIKNSKFFLYLNLCFKKSNEKPKNILQFLIKYLYIFIYIIKLSCIPVLKNYEK